MELRAGLNISKSSSIMQVYNGFKKTFKGRGYFKNNSAWHEMLIEGVENQQRIADIEIKLQELSEYRTRQKIGHESFQQHFVNVCKELMTARDYAKIKEIAMKRYEND